MRRDVAKTGSNYKFSIIFRGSLVIFLASSYAHVMTTRKFDQIDFAKAQKHVADAILGGFGEAYLESSTASTLVFDQNRLLNNQTSANAGVGVRRVLGTETTFAHTERLSTDAIRDMCTSLGMQNGTSPKLHEPKGAEAHRPHDLYRAQSIPALSDRLQVIEAMNETIRALDPRIINVTISLAVAQKDIAILLAEGAPLFDTRPMSRVNINVTVEENGRRETGSSGKGGRYALMDLLNEETWLPMGREALRIALVNLTAQPCPAGEQMLLLGPGWPGVLFHEAVGHGLEGDFNRRGSSAFSKLMGKEVAAKGVRVVDDGTIDLARGSLNFDDEGTITQRNVLIEDGVLVGYMQDRLNAEAMGSMTSGNCRRESYAHQPMPRMTNTFLDNGDSDPNDLRLSLKTGIYAVGFGGGQVDITSGKFVFNCTEAYRVENGEVQYPVKGATLIGDGPTALHKIIGIGNDLALDPGIGNCGKAGQWVPVTVGQPTLLMDGITIGGTEVG